MEKAVEKKGESEHHLPSAAAIETAFQHCAACWQKSTFSLPWVYES